MTECLLNFMPPELVFKIEKQVHKSYMNDLIEEINLEYFRRYEYREYREVNMDGTLSPEIIDNNFDWRPSVKERHDAEYWDYYGDRF